MENNISNESKKGKSKKFYIISIAISVLLVAVIIGTSYAYFSASVDNSNNEVTVIKTGYMELEFTDGELIGTAEDMIPGHSVIKRFKVRNTGNVTTPYDVYLSEVVNTFANKSDLVYSLRTDDNNYNKNEIEAPSAPSKIVEQRMIEPNEEQEYELEILFKEIEENQDINKGKKFNAKISINEYKDARITVNYNANGGNVGTNSVTIIKGETITLPEPERNGYDFAGWYTETLGGSQVTEETQFNDDTTIYAHWSAANYEITYNLNGGSATNPSNYTIETETFTLNNPTKEGYDFVGWSGTDLEGNNNTEVTINNGTIGDRSYTANWKEKTCTVAGAGNFYGVYNKDGQLTECWYGNPNNGGYKCNGGFNNMPPTWPCTYGGDVSGIGRLCTQSAPNDIYNISTPGGNLSQTYDCQ